MNVINKILVLILLFSLLACKTTKLEMPNENSAQINHSEEAAISEIDLLTHLMTGHFTSNAQSIADSSFYDIHLNMYPIWENDENANWLYVEQAAADYLDKPYRQRIYQLKEGPEALIASVVYELPQPEKYIHAWTNPSLFDTLSVDQLKLREGCAVYLQKTSTGCYKGSTKDKTCTSTLRGASYASSRVQICESKIISWDQGWDNNGMQVWGAEKRGYVFDRIVK